MQRSSRGIAGLVSFLLAASPTVGHALTAHDLECQSAIGEAARTFTATRHTALVECNNAVAAGKSCNEVRRDKQNSKASDRLARTISAACRDVDLETLGFPGFCFDPTFGDFTVGDLTACLAEIHASFVDFDLASFEYPNLHGLFGKELRCQRTIGSAGQTFVSKKLRARGHCVDQQLKHAIPAGIDCLAEVPPGTGDQKTDNAIRNATNELRSRLLNACAGVTLDNLGYPGLCFVFDGTFTVDDLRSCIHLDHEFVADLLTRFDYPAIPPTPVPSPSPSPVPSPRPPFCGDGTVDVGEACDPPGVAACAGGASCQSDCTCEQPVCEGGLRSLTLHTAAGGEIDYGWTGIAHHQPLLADVRLQATLLCSGEPCQITDATPLGARFLAPLPLSAGGVASCVVTTVREPISGTYDCTTGCGARSVPVRADFYLVPEVGQPCPVCAGDGLANDGVKQGSCDGGRTPGAACDINGMSPVFGNTSNDCLPSGSSVGELDLDLDLTTGTVTKTANVDCLSQEYPAGSCFCPNQVAPNSCIPDGVCPASGVCEQGPIDGVCSNQSFRQCRPDTGTEDCEDIFPGSGTCESTPRPCFGTTIERSGQCGVDASTMTAFLCFPPTRAAAINTVAGLPGPAVLTLPVDTDGCTCATP